MRNGKIAGRSGPIIFNTSSGMSGRSRILTMEPGWMCPRQFAIIWGWRLLMSLTGNSWKSAMCLRVRGETTAITIISFLRDGKATSS